MRLFPFQSQLEAVVAAMLILRGLVVAEEAVVVRFQILVVVRLIGTVELAEFLVP
jgi:hypothetical protein